MSRVAKTFRIPSEVDRVLQSRRVISRPAFRGIFGFGRRDAEFAPPRPTPAFWEIPDDEALEEFLFGDLLGALYASDADPDALPKGYRPLLYALEFERHCQFESWLAVSNRADDMPDIIESYRFLGLPDEARALSAVFDAYQTVDDDADDFYDVLGKAYSSVPNRTSGFEIRIPLILAFVRANPELFGEPVA